MPSALSSPPLGAGYGYTCKIWMARELERKFLGGKYYTWFARELNPVGDGTRPANGESSNPLNIYSTLDTAVKRKDVNHAKIKDLRAGLLRVISRYVAPADPVWPRHCVVSCAGLPSRCFIRNCGGWTCQESMQAESRPINQYPVGMSSTSLTWPMGNSKL